HSYMPNFMFSDSETFYTFAINTEMEGTWIHNSSRFYQSYYGTKFDHIVEFVAAPNMQTGMFESLEFHTQVHNAVPTGTAYLNAFPVNYIPLRDETFKNIWMYTESQSSDKMSIVPYINSSFM